MTMQRKTDAGFTMIEILIAIAVVGVLAVIAIPQYQDYVIRSKVSECLNFAGPAKTAFAEAQAIQRSVLFDFSPTNYCANVQLAPDGTIVLTTQNTGAKDAPVLQMTPWGAGGGSNQLRWECQFVAGKARHVPGSCRTPGIAVPADKLVDSSDGGGSGSGGSGSGSGADSDGSAASDDASEASDPGAGATDGDGGTGGAASSAGDGGGGGGGASVPSDSAAAPADSSGSDVVDGDAASTDVPGDDLTSGIADGGGGAGSGGGGGSGSGSAGSSGDSGAAVDPKPGGGGVGSVVDKKELTEKEKAKAAAEKEAAAKEAAAKEKAAKKKAAKEAAAEKKAAEEKAAEEAEDKKKKR